MTRTLSEQQVLKKLKIDDFRHLTKDKVVAMASMLDKMDPEVAKKALEQFPNFSATMKEVVAEYKGTLDNLLKENGASVKSFYDTCDAILSSLQKELERDNLSFEERKYVIDKMMDVAQMKGMKDTEDKKFLKTMAAFGLAAVGLAGGLLAAALGANTMVASKNNDEIEEEEV